jgi:hypothetical protein
VIDRVELSDAPYGDLLFAGSSSLTNHVAGVVLRPDCNTVAGPMHGSTCAHGKRERGNVD